MRYSPFLVLLLTFGFSVSAAQFGGSGTASKIQLESKVAKDRATPGSTVKAAVMLTIAEGWHVNSHTPSEEYLIGTALEIKPMEGVILTDITYPRGKDMQFSFSEQPLNVYENTVPIFLSLRLSEKLKPGDYELNSVLTVQACDDN
ncbi:MAG TPA: protein-disulfide reductase DsbD domain-containing protein, partial [Bacteroidota bacterium]